jgi:hypothetical protein
VSFVMALASADAFDVLPPQALTGKPFWEQPWIAPDLRAALFDNLPDGWRVFFLADPTRWRTATGGKDIASAALPSCCLTDLVCDEDLSAAGPHLLDLTLAPGQEVPAAHRLIFRTCPGHGVGVFLRSAFAMDVLARHLAGLMLLPVEDAPERRFFRFWDPSVLSVHLQANAADAQALCWLFRADLAGPPLEIVFETGPTRFALWRLTENGLVPQTDQRPCLRRRDIEVFDAAHQHRVCAAAMDWVCDSYGDKGVARDVLTAAALRQIGPLSDMGITSEYALRYVLAGFYVVGRSLRRLDKADLALLADPSIPQDRRAEDFLRAVQDRTGVTPLEQDAAE